MSLDAAGNARTQAIPHPMIPDELRILARSTPSRAIRALSEKEKEHAPFLELARDISILHQVLSRETGDQRAPQDIERLSRQIQLFHADSKAAGFKKCFDATFLFFKYAAPERFDKEAFLRKFSGEVFGLVYFFHGCPTNDDPEWGKNHAFDDPEIFRLAHEIQRLPVHQKRRFNEKYAEINRFANPGGTLDFQEVERRIQAEGAGSRVNPKEAAYRALVYVYEGRDPGCGTPDMETKKATEAGSRALQGGGSGLSHTSSPEAGLQGRAQILLGAATGQAQGGGARGNRDGDQLQASSGPGASRGGDAARAFEAFVRDNHDRLAGIVWHLAGRPEDTTGEWGSTHLRDEAERLNVAVAIAKLSPAELNRFSALLHFSENEAAAIAADPTRSWMALRDAPPIDVVRNALLLSKAPQEIAAEARAPARTAEATGPQSTGTADVAVRDPANFEKIDSMRGSYAHKTLAYDLNWIYEIVGKRAPGENIYSYLDRLKMRFVPVVGQDGSPLRSLDGSPSMRWVKSPTHGILEDRSRAYSGLHPSGSEIPGMNFVFRFYAPDARNPNGGGNVYISSNDVISYQKFNPVYGFWAEEAQGELRPRSNVQNEQNSVALGNPGRIGAIINYDFHGHHKEEQRLLAEKGIRVFSPKVGDHGGAKDKMILVSSRHAEGAKNRDDIPVETWFDQAFEVLDLAATGVNVLDHCQAGVSRSTTVLAAYMINRFGLSADEALTILRARRGQIQPNEGFMQLLYEYEEKLSRLKAAQAKEKAPVDGTFMAYRRAQG